MSHRKRLSGLSSRSLLQIGKMIRITYFPQKIMVFHSKDVSYTDLNGKMVRLQAETGLITSTLVTGTAVLLALYPVISIAVFIGVRILSNSQSPLFIDFAVYYYAAERFLQDCSLYLPVAGECPPSIDMGNTNPQYVYPPIVVLLFVPFGVLPYLPAALVWDAFVITSLWGGILALINASDAELTMKEQVVVLGCTIGFAPVLESLLLGQTTGLLVGGLCVVGAYLLSDGRKGAISSGAITAIAVAIKPFYLPAGAYLFRNRSRFAAGLLTGLATYVSIIVVFGVNIHRKYLAVVLSRVSGNRLADIPLKEWQPVAFRPFYVFGEAETLVQILVVLVLLTVAASAYLLSESGEVDQYVFALGLLGVAISPGTTTYTLSVLVPVYLVMFIGEADRSNWTPRLLIVSILLVQVHPYTIRFLAKFGPRHVHSGLSTLRPLLPWVQPALWGTLLLLVVVLFRLSEAEGGYGVGRAHSDDERRSAEARERGPPWPSN